MTEDKKSYFAIIPADVRYDENLTPNAKLLYGEITALCNEKGYCWASNAYFAKLYKVSNTSVSLWIKQLKDNGYIEIEQHYKPGTKEILNRYLSILKGGMQEILNTPPQENLKENNTYINNTINNTINKGKGKRILPANLQEVKDYEECVTRDSCVTNADVTLQIREDQIRTEKKREEKSKNFPAEIISLTQKLYDSIDKPTRWDNKPPDLNKWADDIDKLNRIDGISYELIDSVIEFIKQYDRWKWREIIQSGHGFRKHFDTIEKQSKKNHTQTANDMQSDVDYYENKIKEMQR